MQPLRVIPTVLLTWIPTVVSVHGQDPWADTVVHYDPGTGVSESFTQFAAAIGPPTRVTHESHPMGGAVTPFQPPFGTGEIVSIGRGGVLIVAFDEPVRDDPGNPFGIDLLIFNNSFYTMSQVGNDATAVRLAEEGGTISVSHDGSNWIPIDGVTADSAFPTLGFSDLTAPATLVADEQLEPGATPTDFTRPVDPDISVIGHDIVSLSSLYDGSGGGVGIDLATTGLFEISFVRIMNPLDSTTTPEIDAFSDVASVYAPCDLNQDTSIDAADAGILFGDWGLGTIGDCNRDGLTDAADAGEMFSHWTGDVKGIVPEPCVRIHYLGMALTWAALIAARNGQ